MGLDDLRCCRLRPTPIPQGFTAAEFEALWKTYFEICVGP